jgi:hypothetical protein
MIEHTFDAGADTLPHPSRISPVQKSTVWRDGALGLAASIGVGILTGSALTVVVFSLVAITIGQ